MKIKATEITPKNARCCLGPCPSLFKTNRGTLFVVGSAPANLDLPLKVRKKIGQGEVVVEIPIGIIPSLKGGE